MKVKYLLAFLLAFSCYTISLSQIELNFILSNRIHNNQIPLGGDPNPKWVHSAGVGVELYDQQFPFSLSVIRDFYLELDNYDPVRMERAADLDERWIETFATLHYRKKRYTAGLGFYHLLREADLNLQSNYWKREWKGITLSYAQHLKWLDIVLMTKINLDGFAALLGAELYSLSLNYKIGKYEKDLRSSTSSQFEKSLGLELFMGARFFDASDIDVLEFEKGYTVGTKPTLGLECILPNSNFGFFIEKDIWLTFNAGSEKRQVKDRIINNSLGIRYRLINSRERELRFSLGLNFIRDSEVLRSMYTDGFGSYPKLVRNQARGILFGINYELFQNIDIELRHTIPYISKNESWFEPKRFSIGLVYHFDPWKL